jgi:5-methylthioadenosine/S-adenosylhomocysteine deaminase
MRPVEYVAAAGALSPDTLVIHAVEVDEAEVAILAASGAAVAHCPRSNARLRCAAAPVAELLQAGVIVGLGTDSLASNDSLDMFAEMRAALAVAHGRAAAGSAAGFGAVPAPLSPEQVFRMATLEGARALGWGSLTGTLEAGKSADLIAVRLPAGPASAAVPAPGASPLDALVGGASAADVRLTMVAGSVVFSAGVPPAADLSGYRAAREKLGLRG